MSEFLTENESGIVDDSVLSIDIDSVDVLGRPYKLSFQLIGKVVNDPPNNFNISYNYYVLILCYDVKKKSNPYSIFWVYPSTSELGIWRLAGTFQTDNEVMNKLADTKIITTFETDYGTHSFYVGDYVQSTLIHLELQNYLNINIENSALGIITINDLLDERNKIKNIIDYININKRRDLPPVTEETEDTKKNYVTPYNDSDPNLVSIPNRTNPAIKKYGINGFDDTLTLLSPFNRTIYRDNSVNFPYPFIYISIDHIKTEEDKPPILQSFQCGELGDMKVLHTFSEMFENTYDTSEPEKLYDHTNFFLKLINVTGEIFKMTLTRKSDIDSKYLTYDLDPIPGSSNITINPETDILPVVELYYLKAVMNCVDPNPRDLFKIGSNDFVRNAKRICNTGQAVTHFMPILLTVPEAKINKFGIYNKYINAGSYICKMFDYHYQCFSTENLTNRCSRSYTYIGQRYKNLFPFNQMSYITTGSDITETSSIPLRSLKEPEPTTTTNVGGRMRKRTNKKRKTKRRKSKRRKSQKRVRK
jgi:hypothetical protein